MNFFKSTNSFGNSNASIKGMTTLLCMVCFAIGCADTPPPAEPKPAPLPPTQINLQINSDTGINPDINNKASPVLVRIYELKEQSNFVNADFFALFEKEQATLAGDLVHKQEMLVKPGEKTTLPIAPDANTKMLGFFAAFRQLDNAQWRVIQTLEQHKNNEIVFTIKQNTLAVTLKASAVADKPNPN